MSKFFFGHTMSPSSAYYRMIGYAKKMEKLHKVYFNEWNPKLCSTQRFFEDMMEREETRPSVIRQLEYLGVKVNVDAWVFQLMATPWGLSIMDLVQRHWKKPFITEVDDNFLHVNADNPSAEFYQPGHDNVKLKTQQCEESSMLITSTEYLKKKLEHLNHNIVVIPNAVDFSLWKVPIKDPTSPNIVVGWEGGAGHQADLEILEDVIPEIVKRYPNVKIQLLGYVKDNPVFKIMKNVEIIEKWLPIADYPAFKSSLNWDIELAPLVDTEFNRCKSNLRWLEASALKIPVVASNVQPYKTTNALLCKTDSQWVEAISKLIESRSLREEIGNQGYKMARKDYAIGKIAKLYATTLENEVKRVEAIVKNLKVEGKI